jgi:thioredoxin-related protein
MMEQNTWSHPVIATYASANFHCVRLDAESRDSIPFNGTKFPYLPDLHANQLAYLLLEGKMEYPALVLMEPSGAVLLTLRGYFTPRLMDEVLRYFGGGFYRSMSWETFQKAYPSQL